MDNLEPSRLWALFAEVCAIPHPSGGESRLADYIVAKADDAGVECRRDAAGNVLVRVPSSPGRVEVPTTILQAHLDMVPQKNAAKEHDFKSDPITPVIDGGWVAADGTTLGADNGIGVAAMLAIMEMDDLDTGPIDLLFTVKEEVGLVGAAELDGTMLDADILINLDSEEVDTIITGCAGGADTEFSSRLDFERVSGADWSFFSLCLSGLEGGHSGVDIHLRRGNAIIELARVIDDVSGEVDCRVADIRGGSLSNAIPREAEAILAVPKGADIATAVEAAETAFRRRSRSTDPEAELETAESAPFLEIASKEGQRRLIRLLADFPDGPFDVCEDFESAVQSSSNLGAVELDKGQLFLRTMQRGVSSEFLNAAIGKVSSHALSLGCDAKKGAAFPPWTPSRDSSLLKRAVCVAEKVLGRPPKVEVIHAGLECGVIGAKRRGMEMISIGPTIKHPHSPNERVEIESVAIFHEVLIRVLSGTEPCRK